MYEANSQTYPCVFLKTLAVTKMIRITKRLKNKNIVMSYLPSRRLNRIHGLAPRSLAELLSQLGDDQYINIITGFLIHETLHRVLHEEINLEACKKLDNLDILSPSMCIPD